MVAQFIRLAVWDEATAAELQQSLQRQGVRVWKNERALEVLSPQRDMEDWLQGWVRRDPRREVNVLEQRRVEVADEFFASY